MLKLSEHAARQPKFWFWLSGIISLLLIIAVLVPTLSPQSVPFLKPLHIDTDPENMLSPDEPVRVFHNQMKKTFSLYDMVVVGVVNRKNPDGVFNVASLGDIYKLTHFAKDIHWQEKGKEHGVISADVIAPSTVDNVEQAGLGSVRFEWLMANPPATEAEAKAIAAKAKRIPFLNNTLISDDGKALALYIPIVSKSDSYQVAEKLREEIATFKSGDEYYITGLPIAQDQFGVEMFKQMAISAPLAMALIFALMWYFFRHVKLIIAPMIVAMVSVIFTMGLLVVTGNTVHIMSSMIPIFIMPIAVLDAVHILSDFFDRYPRTKDRYKTLKALMEELWKPMLYTSLTTCAGFGSLAFTPIPPVQVFGIFIAIGVFFAWLLTITLVPAYIMLMPESSLEGFGMGADGNEKLSPLARFLQKLGPFTYHQAKLILLITLMLAGVAYYGITKIQINDNPVKWFEKGHEIRIADKVLNEKFAGTYMAYLALQAPKAEAQIFTKEDITQLPEMVRGAVANEVGQPLDTVKDFVLQQQDEAKTDADWDAWDKASLWIDKKQQELDVFKRPDVLRYIEGLQAYLLKTGYVGKSNGLPDIVKTVHRDLFLGNQDAYVIPDTEAAVAQTLITYQGSHRPQDLWHFVTPDYRNTNLWIQLKSGDNKAMEAVIKTVDSYIADNPPPVELSHKWFGLTYINVIWQQKMVKGMLEAFAGSFAMVLLMMTVLFRSPWWGILSMIPLTVTIALIYGVIGLIGKDYDMPVAVLSALSLGLAVDYAIHFLARTREIHLRHPSWSETLHDVFGEPARAIARNVIVIGMGFLPLLAAPLIPYQTVGVFISAILVIAGAATLFILPAMMTVFQKLLFKKKQGKS